MWVDRIAVAIAAPNEPPTVRVTVLMPDATPTSRWSTELMTRLAIEASDNVRPVPNRAPETTKCQGLECTRAIPVKATAAIRAPVARTTREPKRASSLPTYVPATSWATATGTSRRPATVTEEPKP